MAKDKQEQALDTLAYYHANGDRNDATVQFEYHEIKETIALECQAKQNSGYLDFVKTPGNRYRLMLLISLGVISQYSGNALLSNYANKVYEQAGLTGEERTTGVSSS